MDAMLPLFVLKGTCRPTLLTIFREYVLRTRIWSWRRIPRVFQDNSNYHQYTMDKLNDACYNFIKLSFIK